MSDVATAVKTEQVFQLRDRIHRLLFSTQQEDAPHFYRIEWFHDHQSSVPSSSVGYVKFILIVGIVPHIERPFSVQMGYTIIKPARVPEARGVHQDYGWTNGIVRTKFEDSIHLALGNIARTRIVVEDIERALDHTLALQRQPYKQSDYFVGDLEHALSGLYENGHSCIASDAFSNPLHPQLTYELVAQKNDATVVLHCIGVSRRSTTLRSIRDIRTYKGTIGEIAEEFHDSLRDSYISPQELTAAISRFQPTEAGYFK